MLNGEIPGVDRLGFPIEWTALDEAPRGWSEEPVGGKRRSGRRGYGGHTVKRENGLKLIGCIDGLLSGLGILACQRVENTAVVRAEVASAKGASDHSVLGQSVGKADTRREIVIAIGDVSRARDIPQASQKDVAI